MDSFWDFFWFILSFFLLMAYLVVLFQVLTDLFRDRTTKGAVKAIWVVGLVLFPLVTAVAYLILRGEAMAERQMGYARAVEADAEAYIRSVSSGRVSAVDEITRAKALLDAGAISAEEFELLKGRALAG